MAMSELVAANHADFLRGFTARLKQMLIQPGNSIHAS
jgi:hypothetical protein